MSRRLLQSTWHIMTWCYITIRYDTCIYNIILYNIIVFIYMRGCHKQYVMGRDCTEAIIEPIMAGRTNRFLLQRHCPWDGLCETSGVECLGILGHPRNGMEWLECPIFKKVNKARGADRLLVERLQLAVDMTFGDCNHEQYKLKRLKGARYWKGQFISSYIQLLYHMFQHISSQLESQTSKAS